MPDKIVKCAYPYCRAQHKTNYWSRMAAHNNGWFEQKDGTEYCPKHVPEWVEEWRKKK